jgi:hypothetical protein
VSNQAIEPMHLYPANRDAWFGLLLFPFKAYLPIGVIYCAFLGSGVVDGDIAAAKGLLLLGYVFCSFAIVLAAMILFLAHKRELVAETLLLAGVSLLTGVFATV